MFQRALAVAGSLLFLAAPLHAQSARDIMEEAMDRYAERMEGIQSYTVTQTVMDMETTLVFTRDESDGRVTFVPDLSDMEMLETGVEGQYEGAASGQRYDSNYFMRDEFIERMREEGKETVDGRETYVLAIDDFEGLDLSDFSAGANSFTPSLIRIYLDDEEYLPRRMDMAGSVSMGGHESEMATTVLMKDYREVDGMLYPFIMELQTDGLGSAMGAAMGGGGLTAEQRAEMEAQLEQLPESQRDMVRKMMEAQMEGGMAAMMDETMGSMIVETLRLEVSREPVGSP